MTANELRAAGEISLDVLNGMLEDYYQQGPRAAQVLIMEHPDGTVQGVHCTAGVAALMAALEQLLTKDELEDLLAGLTQLVNRDRYENHARTNEEAPSIAESIGDDGTQAGAGEGAQPRQKRKQQGPERG